MKKKGITVALLFAVSFTGMFGQNPTKQSSVTLTECKFTVSTTYYSFLNFEEEKTNTHLTNFMLVTNLLLKYC